MGMLRENSIKKIFRIQIICFVLFSVLAICFYWYQPAHVYYYKEKFFINLNSVIALVGYILKVLFFWVILFFPILWIIELIILLKRKMFKKYFKFIVVSVVVYVIAAFSLFALMSVNNKQRFKQNKITESCCIHPKESAIE